HAFPQIMPEENNKVHGAVSYTASGSFNPALPGDAVTVHALLDTDETSEAEQVLNIIDQTQAEHPEDSIAILLRSKIHVADIVRRLKQRGSKFQAVEIDKLSQRPVVRDLLALSCALLHPGDRISWLAILRAPWCGLTLADLHALVGGDQKAAVYDQLIKSDSFNSLSEDGVARLARVQPILKTVLAQRGRQGLRDWIESAWIALGGPACLGSDTDKEDAEVFLQLLETLDAVGKAVGPEVLHDKVAELFALPDVHADSRLQIMTMHKAKGLEFDTVILPGLSRTTRGDESRLLYWLQRTSETGEPELVFGPIKSAREKENRTAEYIKQLDKEKSMYEYGRLLYVAATRARQRLHLLGQVKTDSETGEVKVPANTTLLYQFWPVVGDVYEVQAALSSGNEPEQPEPEEPPVVTNKLRRLESDWTCPPPPSGVLAMPEVEEEREFNLEFDWAGESARLVGTVVHRILEQLTRQADAPEKDDELTRLNVIGRQMLVQEGLPRDQVDAAASKVESALNNMLQDERGRWILSSAHQDARSEYALTFSTGEQTHHMIIDRTFIDEEGVRWIIDYKTGSHAGGGLDEFLDREQDRYQDQLENYANAMSRMDDRPVRLGLYFPLLQGWREWSFED
ncbi:MAG TPA: DNA helicase UvrD, partial [Gammaproteobacteria bacterium]|nr:DNA helicase UvrD [Gammaproteobacteria bacterium]